jgi:hypothetical protein
MSNPARCLLGVFLIVGFSTGGARSDEKAKEQVPLPKPQELKVLNRFLGTWDTDMVAKQAAWTPKEVKSKGVSTFEWMLDGRFMSSKSKSGEPDKIESFQLMTYHPGEKKYFLWFFDSNGAVSEANGTWDADNQTLTWKSEIDENLSSLNLVRFTDRETIDWTMTVRDKTNKVYLDLRGKMKRRKKEE